MKIVSILATFGAASLLALSAANASDHDRRSNSENHASEQHNYDDGGSRNASSDARSAASILGYALSGSHYGYSNGYGISRHRENYGYRGRGYSRSKDYRGRGYQRRGYRGNRGYSGQSNRSYRGRSYGRGY